MSLDTLPSDILGYILNRPISSYLVIKLWKTGSLLLQSKLSKCITRVDLAPHPAARLQSPPQLLNRLQSLRYFSYANEALALPINFAVMIKSLHKNLETLSLTVADFSTSFFLYNAVEERENMFQSLHTLTIIRRARNPAPLNFTFLPPSLTELNLDDDDIRVSKVLCPVLSTLPRRLKRLGADLTVYFETTNRRNNETSESPSTFDVIRNDWSEAPEDLEYIRTLRWKPDSPETAWMPRTLTSGHFDHFRYPWTYQHAVNNTPPGLTEISLLPIDYSSFTANHTTWVAMLPKTLRTLSVWAPTYAPPTPGVFIMAPPLTTSPLIITAIELSCMPRTITNLLVEHAIFDWDTFPDVNANSMQLGRLWPPKLEALSFLLEDSRPGLLSLLPRSLHRMRIIYSPTSLGDHSSKIHVGETENISTLQNLTIISTAHTSLIEFEGSLPRSLTSLSLVSWDSASNGLSRSSFENLPDSITYLELHLACDDDANAHQADSPWKLPAKLDVLKVSTWHCAWFSFLPPNLRHLSISKLTGVDTTNSSENDLFSTLPKHLTDLKLTGTIVGQEKGKLLSFSPLSFSTLRHLIEVHCAFSNGHFPSAIIRNLPASLRVLSLRLETLKAEDAPFLSPWIKSLALGAFVPWKEDFIRKYWPPMSFTSLPTSHKETIEFVKSRISELH